MTCKKKKFGYFDVQIALVQAEMKRKCDKHFGKKRKECRSYWCEECDAYHLTSMEKIK